MGGSPVWTRQCVIDITERKRAEQIRTGLEAQIQHAQKLESLLNPANYYDTF